MGMASGVLLILLGGTVLAGWLFRLPSLLQPLPGHVAMVFNTALCFFMAGLALVISHRWRWHLRLQIIFGALITLIAGAMLLEQLANINFGIDLSKFHAWLSDPNPTPGRMAPNTALAFLLAGIAIILMPHTRGILAWRMIEMLAFAIVLIGLTGAVGYTLKLEFLYGWYQYTRMALPTAAGMIVLGIGLWSRWQQSPQTRMQQMHTHHRIIWVGGSVFFSIALIAGLGGFAIMQQRTETTLQNGLFSSLQNRSDLFSFAVQDAFGIAQLIASRPVIHRHMQKLNAEPGNAAELVLLSQAAKSFLPLGFSSIRFHDRTGREMVHVGTFIKTPELAVPLPMAHPAQLLWQKGFVLEARLPMLAAGQYLGSVTLQRPLDILTRMLHDTRGLGETGEMAVCARDEPKSMWCFPLRFNPKALRLPYEINGQPLPMSHALEGKEGVITAFDYRRQNVSAAYAPIGELGLGMVLKTDTAELYRPIGDQLRWAMLLLLVLIAGGMWILHLLVMPLVRRMAESEERYRAVTESANEAIVTANAQGIIVYWNRAAQTVFGYSEKEILGQPTSRLIQETHRTAHEQGWRRQISTDQPELLGQTVEMRGLHQDGRELPLEMSLSSWRNRDGERYFTVILRDISLRKQGEEARHQLAAIVESSSDAIFSKDLKHIITSWNAAAERLFGYRADEIIGQSSHVLLPADKHFEEQEFLEQLRKGQHIERHETVRIKKDGSTIEVAVTISPLRDASGHIIGTSTIARDITERKRKEAQARALSLTDELTGLHNRRGFIAIAEQQLKLARRSRTSLHIGFIDMDGMKTINDRFGHAIGDQAIKDTATVLRTTFRDSDVLARLGGDEFVVLIIGADEAATQLILERLSSAVARANQTNQRPYTLSISIGVVACTLEPGANLEQMIEEADRRMYKIKGEKRRAG